MPAGPTHPVRIDVDSALQARTACTGFGVGVLQWSIRGEAYVLLLHDEYPPFRLAVAS